MVKQVKPITEQKIGPYIDKKTLEGYGIKNIASKRKLLPKEIASKREKILKRIGGIFLLVVGLFISIMISIMLGVVLSTGEFYFWPFLFSLMGTAIIIFGVVLCIIGLHLLLSSFSEGSGKKSRWKQVPPIT